jgi:hypothetical protein
LGQGFAGPLSESDSGSSDEDGKTDAEPKDGKVDVEPADPLLPGYTVVRMLRSTHRNVVVEVREKPFADESDARGSPPPPPPPVVFKIYRPHDPVSLGACVREFAVLAALGDRPEIVAAKRDGARLMMDAMDGTLADFLTPELRLRGGELLSACRQVLGAVDLLHSLRIAHMRIRPRHFLYQRRQGTGDGAIDVRLADFSRAVFFGRGEGAFVEVGGDDDDDDEEEEEEGHYVPPECRAPPRDQQQHQQRRRRRAVCCEAVDLWAVGVLLVELALGQRLSEEARERLALPGASLLGIVSGGEVGTEADQGEAARGGGGGGGEEREEEGDEDDDSAQEDVLSAAQTILGGGPPHLRQPARRAMVGALRCRREPAPMPPARPSRDYAEGGLIPGIDARLRGRLARAVASFTYASVSATAKDGSEDGGEVRVGPLRRETALAAVAMMDAFAQAHAGARGDEHSDANARWLLSCACSALHVACLMCEPHPPLADVWARFVTEALSRERRDSLVGGRMATIVGPDPSVVAVNAVSLFQAIGHAFPRLPVLPAGVALSDERLFCALMLQPRIK